MLLNSDWKLDSSSNSEGKPSSSMGTMKCCKIQTGRRPQHRWWHGTSGCVGSGALLVLLPKCPLCIAAYLTLWTGAGVAMPVATHLRPIAAILFCASALFLAVRLVAARPLSSRVGDGARSYRQLRRGRRFSHSPTSNVNYWHFRNRPDQDLDPIWDCGYERPRVPENLARF
jgi:hypothetical protein